LDKAQPKQQMVTNHNKIEDADKKKKKGKIKTVGHARIGKITLNSKALIKTTYSQKQKPTIRI
jgi:hypothetical protein